MANAYKKFTANDIATVPFNAHKLYNFTSASAVLNKVTYFNANWTSESIDLYSSESIKYNQIDHLFYKNNKKNLGYNFGEQHYAKQRRVLYENLNIISVPNGLIGYEIKPNSLFISTSKGEFIEDTHGNLIVSGTNLSDYPDDIQENVFSLEPVKGFKRFDLDVFSDYVNYEFLEGKDDPGKHDLIVGSYWRRGKTNPNPILTYTTDKNVGLNQTYIPEIAAKERDESYFRNELSFNKMNYSVGGGISNASQLSFTSTNTSFI